MYGWSVSRNLGKTLSFMEAFYLVLNLTSTLPTLISYPYSSPCYPTEFQWYYFWGERSNLTRALDLYPIVYDSLMYPECVKKYTLKQILYLISIIPRHSTPDLWRHQHRNIHYFPHWYHSLTCWTMVIQDHNVAMMVNKVSDDLDEGFLKGIFPPKNWFSAK